MNVDKVGCLLRDRETGHLVVWNGVAAYDGVLRKMKEGSANVDSSDPFGFNS